MNLFNQKNVRRRWREVGECAEIEVQGYDEDLGFALRRVTSVRDFVLRSDPIRVLTEAHEVGVWRSAEG